MAMSYRHVWELVDSMNRQAAEPLVELATGGRGGGGALITGEGAKVIGLFWKLYADFQDFLGKEEKKAAGLADSLLVMRDGKIAEG